MMNKKATISKELNAKHVKILEGLLKLPQNRQCADCKNKAPRWASINLGVFICLQCSGIHRSLGVHISKVRSATLDTWLPDQVAFMQEMGNEKANAYWEAELPVNYNRSRFENFIPAKYVEKKWVRRDKIVKSSRTSKEELASPCLSRSGSSSTSTTDTASNRHTETKECLIVEKEASSVEQPSSAQSLEHKNVIDYANNQHMEVKTDCSIVGKQDVDAGNPQVRKDSAEDQITIAILDSNDGPKKDLQNTKPAVQKEESTKADYATELYRMLCLDDSTESDSSPSSDMSSWVDFDTDEEATQGKDERRTAENDHPEHGIKVVATSKVLETKRLPRECQIDATDDNQDRSEEQNNAMTLMPSQVESSPPHVTRVSNRKSQTFLNGIHQQQGHFSQAPSLNGPKSINHSPGTQLPMLNVPPVKFVANTASYTASSMYRSAAPLNGIPTTHAKKPPATLPVSGYDYDFSFLTQGMFTKQ